MDMLNEHHALQRKNTHTLKACNTIQKQYNDEMYIQPNMLPFMKYDGMFTGIAPPKTNSWHLNGIKTAIHVTPCKDRPTPCDVKGRCDKKRSHHAVCYQRLPHMPR